MDSLQQLEKEIEESLPPAVKLFIEQLREHIEYLEDNPPCCSCDKVDYEYFEEEHETLESKLEAYKSMYYELIDQVKKVASDKGIDDIVQYLYIRNEKVLTEDRER